MTIEDWDVTEYLDSPESIAGYLDAALEDGDTAMLQAAIGDVAKAMGMTAVAANAGVSRTSLYKSLTADAAPSFETINKVLQALGVRLSVSAA